MKFSGLLAPSKFSTVLAIIIMMVMQIEGAVAFFIKHKNIPGMF